MPPLSSVERYLILRLILVTKEIERAAPAASSTGERSSGKDARLSIWKSPVSLLTKYATPRGALLNEPAGTRMSVEAGVTLSVFAGVAVGDEPLVTAESVMFASRSAPAESSKS